MSNVANGSPTKKFFIEMLTRDIALNDAILDLLDNCLDGVINSKGAKDKSTNKEYYKGYKAEITISKDSFEIKDNCGGIPRDVAEKYAFRMGRDSDETGGAPTVGIYGIGMKRAIFKIGKEAIVKSNHKDNAFFVEIPDDWAGKADDWNFPITDVNDMGGDKGTCITIRKLTEDVAIQWKDGNLDNFMEGLIPAIKSSYSFIIEKGFDVSVNGTRIQPFPVQLLVSEEKGKQGIKPYIFKKDYNNNGASVSVSLAVGFYAPMLSEKDLDDEARNTRSSSDAGWSIVCNDRVVLYNDRTHLTGWGEAGVPQYHTQFIGIRGVVVFESNNPKLLPMTTTKRGIDLSSSIYADVKNKMREGLRMFTQYTNQWKGRNDQEREHSKATEAVSISSILSDDFAKEKRIKFKPKDKGEIYIPNLPEPPNDKNYEIIRYSKPKSEIDKVRKFLYPDDSIPVKTSKVGEECFDQILSKFESGK